MQQPTPSVASTDSAANTTATSLAVAPPAAESAAPAPSASNATPDDRATSFQAVKGGGEQVPGGNLLIGAYAVIWVIMLLVVVRVFRRQSATTEQIAALEKAIEQAGKK
jgi:hypothetical protein